jgi:hypothetical protein
MKEFRKTQEGLFICEECNRLFNSQLGLGTHIGMIHNSKLYYDKWIKEKDEGICKICGKETKFSSKIVTGYYKTCSENCENINRVNSIKQTLFRKFKVKNVYQLKKVKEKKIQTYLKHFGVKHNMQNKECFEKQQKAAFNVNYYKNTNIYYRGSYEFDFLEKYLEKYPDIQNAPFIKYNFDNKEKIYYPDFLIASLNLIVECKNSYLVQKDKLKLEAKEKATIASGFKYIMIVDKNYKYLECINTP